MVDVTEQRATEEAVRRARDDLEAEVLERRRAEETLRAGDDRYRRQQAALLELIQRDVRGDGEGAAIRHVLEVAARTLGVERVSVWHYVGDRAGLRAVDLYERSADRHTAGEELPAADCPNYFRAPWPPTR